MSLVLYTDLKPFFIAAKLRYKVVKSLNIVPANNSHTKVLYCALQQCLADNMLFLLVQVTWGDKGATEQGSKLTKAKVCIKNKVIPKISLIHG